MLAQSKTPPQCISCRLARGCRGRLSRPCLGWRLLLGQLRGSLTLQRLRWTAASQGTRPCLQGADPLCSDSACPSRPALMVAQEAKCYAQGVGQTLGCYAWGLPSYCTVADSGVQVLGKGLSQGLAPTRRASHYPGGSLRMQVNVPSCPPSLNWLAWSSITEQFNLTSVEAIPCWRPLNWQPGHFWTSVGG